MRWIGTSNSVFEGDIQSILDVDYESNDYLIASEFTVSDDLIVVGDDWWIERHIHDCYEWWEFKSFERGQSNEGFSYSIICYFLGSICALPENISGGFGAVILCGLG